MCNMVRYVNTLDDAYTLEWDPDKIVFGGYGSGLAMSKEDWYKLKGLDQRMFGWGYEDNDIYNRARCMIKMSESKTERFFHIAHEKTYLGEKNMKIHKEDVKWHKTEESENWGLF